MKKLYRLLLALILTLLLGVLSTVSAKKEDHDPKAFMTYEPSMLLVKIDKVKEKFVASSLKIWVSRKDSDSLCPRVRKVILGIMPTRRFGENLPIESQVACQRSRIKELPGKGLCNFDRIEFKLDWSELQSLSGYSFSSNRDLIKKVCSAAPNSPVREVAFTFSTILKYGSRLNPNKDAIESKMAGEEVKNFVMRYVCE